MWVCGSFPQVAVEGQPPYNTLVLAGPDGTEQRYRKIHRFTYGGEDGRFSAGTDRVTVEVEGLRVTLFVCYDLRFADEWWAVAPDTDVYVCVANWPEARRLHWQTLLRARATRNQAYVVACNRWATRHARLLGRQRHRRPDGRGARLGRRHRALVVAEVTAAASPRCASPSPSSPTAAPAPDPRDARHPRATRRPHHNPTGQTMRLSPPPPDGASLAVAPSAWTFGSTPSTTHVRTPDVGSRDRWRVRVPMSGTRPFRPSVCNPPRVPDVAAQAAWRVLAA